MGIVNEWSARMVNTRDSHAALDGKRVMQGETFRTIWGNDLRYPGDPTAPAREVINCHCVLVPDVLLPGEKLDAQGNVVSADVVESSGGSSGAKKTPGWESRHVVRYYEEIRNRKAGHSIRLLPKEP